MRKTALDRNIRMLCQAEGKKSQVSRGDMKEVLARQRDLFQNDTTFAVTTMVYLLTPVKKRKAKRR